MNIKRQMLHSSRQGLVKVFILQQAAQSPVYGGKLQKQLQAWGYDISAGRLYPLLHAFEKGRLLTSHVQIVQGRIRKYYEITDQGRTVLAEVQQELAGILNEILSKDRHSSNKNCSQEQSYV